eukprot:gene17713-21156_t
MGLTNSDILHISSLQASRSYHGAIVHSSFGRDGRRHRAHGLRVLIRSASVPARPDGGRDGLDLRGSPGRCGAPDRRPIAGHQPL